MTKEEKEEFAALIDAAFARHPPICPNGIDPETAATLKAFSDAVRSGKKTVYKTVLTAVACFSIQGIIWQRKQQRWKLRLGK